MRYYTATELNRFMACNGSKLMGAQTPVSQNDEARQEGIAAHWLIEKVFTGANSAEELIDRKAPNQIFITGEIVENTSGYLNNIRTLGGMVEESYDLSGQEWIVNGRTDHSACSGPVLYINDFKYGWRIIEPENNWSMISHAIGLIKKYNLRPDRIVFTIYQPRPVHPVSRVREWRISFDELIAYYAQLTYALDNPQNTVRTSPECYKCPALIKCGAAIKAGMNVLEVADDVYDANLGNEDLSFMLDQMKRGIEILSENLKAYEEQAVYKIKDGEIIKNYNMVSELTNKIWKKGMTTVILKILTGVDLSKNDVVTPAQAKKLGVAEDVIESLTERIQKGFKLVRVDADKQAKKILGKIK